MFGGANISELDLHILFSCVSAAKPAQIDKMTCLDTDLLCKRHLAGGIKSKHCVQGVRIEVRGTDKMTLVGGHKWQDQAGGGKEEKSRPLSC